MVVLVSKKSATLSLYQREIGVLKCNQRSSLKILKNLICGNSRTYNKIWDCTSSTPIYTDVGKIYLDHFTKCYSLFGFSWMPTLLYKQDKNEIYGKVIDMVTFSSSVISWKYVSSQPSTYKRFLMTLSSKNWLRISCIETGLHMESIYLGDEKRLKFTQVDWEKHGQTVVVFSKNNPYHSSSSRERKPDTLVVIALFQVLPLKFVAKLEIKRSVFGHDVTNCNVTEDLLILGSGTKTCGHVRLYNFNEVVQEGLVFTASLNKPCSQFHNGVVGSYPDGTPLNCIVKKAPPCLFEVRCGEHALHFGGYPFHYVTVPPNKRGTFQVKSITKNELVKDGEVDLRTSTEFESHISFHPDDSGKIVHVSGHLISIFAIKTNDHGERVLNPIGEYKILNLLPSEPNWQASPKTGKRKSGRVTKKIFKVEDFCDRTLLANSFENELDIYGILGYTGMFFDTTGRVQLYDNDNCDLVKVVNLGINLNDISFYQMTLDLDFLIIQQKSGGHPKFSCTVYRLDSANCGPVPVQKTEKPKPKKNRKRVLVFGSVIDDDEESAGETWMPEND